MARPFSYQQYVHLRAMPVGCGFGAQYGRAWPAKL